ncbi:helix-turn-helix domain-containing protein [Agromyces ramosus]|uniref:Transposase n=1 Tax=Agromyces ramosus TaxID=33879 RepID=A0ABU0R8N9_9MICO|nr:helix-turn-helix domain-containing protein [Agromyces ramosus]MDQ0894439.1 transposase [Agromyces ramosus]
MARNGTFDSKRAEAQRLFDEGLSCRAIAKKLKCSPSTVSRWAEREGLKFDRAQTAAAVEAHKVDLAAERLLLAEEMMAAGREALREIRGKVTVYNIGGKDNTFTEHELERAPMSMRREALTAAGIAFDKATRIVEKDNGGLDQAVGVLDALADGFKAAAVHYRAETPPEGTDEPE